MHILKNIPLNVDDIIDGIHFNLNLYSKGNKPNYLDDFPRSIVRTTGARFEILNLSTRDIEFDNLYLVICINNDIIKAYTNLSIGLQKLKPNSNFEIAFEGKELKSILSEHENEQGIVVISSKDKIYHSSLFSGDLIEEKLQKLNRDTEPEYQNWHFDEFTKLDKIIDAADLDIRIKSVLNLL